MILKEQRALVTGGAVRIGRAIAEALIAEGAEVIVHFQTSERDRRARFFLRRTSKACSAITLHQSESHST